MSALLLTAGPATSQQQQEAKPSPSGASCTVVPGAKIVEFSPAATLTQALKGRVAGLQIKTADGWAGSGSTVSLRGVNSVVGPFEPMVFVDGARLTPLNRTNTGDHSAIQILDLINPEDVARVEVLRGPAATAMYGTQGSGGVIHVFTKQGNPKLAPVTDPKRGCP
jgi:TonB-dependent SusC/RagA subfamily outer membrane receptor